MNMKKTIAALAAGAVAVSAMATTVSALESTTLNYNLAAAKKFEAAGTVNLSGTVANVQAGDDILVGFNNVPANFTLKKLVVTFKDTAGGAGNKVFTYDTAWNSDNFIGWSFTNNSYIITANSLAAGLDTTAGAMYDVTIVGTFEHAVSLGLGSTSDVLPRVQAAGTKCYIDTVYRTDEAQYVPVVATGAQAPAAADTDLNGDGDTTDTDVYVFSDTLQTIINEGTNINDVLPSAFVGKTEKVIYRPFETKVTGNRDVIAYLENANVNGNDKSYFNVGPVLNDAIENFESVVFKFNSAKQNVKFGILATDKATGADSWDSNNDKDTYDAAVAFINDMYGQYTIAKDKGEAWRGFNYDANLYSVMPYYVDNGGTDYTVFGQHLYNGMTFEDYFKAEGTNYLGFDWDGFNLFQGGLVINEGLTMSLSNTQVFDWDASSVSFAWDAVMDVAATENAYSLYLHTMELATSNRWYWDSLDVELTAGAVDDATSDAGAEADDEVLDEEPVEEEEITEEEITEEEITEEEVEEEATEEEVEEEATEEEVEEEATEEETEEVSNPTTGNASVALAVIPVALAAAAVVAKKRS